MFVYFMLKPGFSTKENIIDFREGCLTPENRFSVICDGFVRYNKRDIAGFDPNCNPADRAFGDSYAVTAEFGGTEAEWIDFRRMLFDDEARYDYLKENGAMVSEALDRAIYASDTYEASTKDICKFIKAMGETARHHADDGNKQLSESMILDLRLFKDDIDVRKQLLDVTKELEAKSDKKFDETDAYEVRNWSKQLAKVSNCANSTCKGLNHLYNKVKYQYQR